MQDSASPAAAVADHQRPRVWLVPSDGPVPDAHSRQSRLALLPRIATLLGGVVGGMRDDAAQETVDAADYFVPEDCLVADRAVHLGAADAARLFGGVVPHAFVAGKAVVHPLVDDDAVRPAGWVAAFGDTVREVTLPGLSAFSRDDALRAAARLLEGGAIRVKRVLGIGGRGQWVAPSLDQTRRILDGIDPDELHVHGLVFECNLQAPQTFSVGEARIGRHHVAYHGTQQLVRSRDGTDVYGGSTLHVHRGGLDALLAAALPPRVRRAVRQAVAFDRCVAAAYPGFVATRRNYDVAAGRDAQGRQRCGVLEQSWRIGGATAAELLAMQAFDADPSLAAVSVSTHEFHAPVDIPEGALVYWHDPQEPDGPILKYAQVHDADPA